MAETNRDSPSDRIGVPDPAHEPKPPKLGSAGELGPTAERKQEKTGLEDKDRIWQERPPAGDEAPKK